MTLPYELIYLMAHGPITSKPDNTPHSLTYMPICPYAHMPICSYAICPYAYMPYAHLSIFACGSWFYHIKTRSDAYLLTYGTYKPICPDAHMSILTFTYGKCIPICPYAHMTI